jgi:hypothetical protein
MSGTQDSFFEGLTTAVRDNPLAAALIGGGALWLLIRSDSFKNAAGSVAAAAAPVGEMGARGGRAVAAAMEDGYESVRDRTLRMQEEASRRMGDTINSARSTTSDALAGTMGTINEHFDDGVSGARQVFDRIGRALPSKDTFVQAQSSLADLFERQPLVLGAVGLAIGASVAGAVAKSDLEDEWVGELSDSVKADLGARASAVSERVGEAVDGLKADLGGAGGDYVDRLQQAGRNAVNAAQAKVSS